MADAEAVLDTEMFEKAHETVPLRYGEDVVDIDIEISNLILVMWRAGVPTRYCCEGYDVPEGDDPNLYKYRSHRGYIAMPNTTESYAFVQALFTNYFVKTDRTYSWEIEINQNPLFGPTLVLRFPKSEIEKLTEFTRFVANSGILR